MPKIISDSIEIKELLLELEKIIIDNGGYLNPLLNILEKDNNFSIVSHSNISKYEKLIVLNNKLLPNIDLFDIDIIDNRFHIKNSDISKDTITYKLIDIQLEIFNYANKLEHYKSDAFFYSLVNREDILKSILSTQNIREIYSKYFKKYYNNEKELLKEEFFKSRTFGLKDDKGEKVISTVLMPFVDYCNHNTNSTGFAIIEENYSKKLAILNHTIDKTKEVYVKYNDLCPVFKLITYGFVDKSADRFYSRPVTVELKNGKSFEIDYNIGSIKKEMIIKGGIFKDIGHLFPYVNLPKEYDNKRVKLSTIAIPNATAPLSMRRIIIASLKSAWKDMNSNQLRENMLKIEDAILTENYKFANYLQSLKSLTKRDKNVIKMLNEVGVMLEEWLYNYKNNEILDKIKLI